MAITLTPALLWINGVPPETMDNDPVTVLWYSSSIVIFTPVHYWISVQTPLPGCSTCPQLLIGKRGFNQFNRHTTVINHRHPVIVDGFIRPQDNRLTCYRLSQTADLKGHMWNGFQ
ncbi:MULTISPECIES: hypothetical protein [Klebsiella/Raoultella group]|uniref:hypothetical protein n=1 Tax=Klebsiella/Raoultella group TaxID=2890311 RepID=UPI0015E4C6CD|nr:MULTISPECIES: hypothetical protein [Klebsiella]MBA8303661.1 hypothetical protein [Klebsiella michiganensis]MBG2622812.1 hypothetical protein [Klebsiella michiganensis]MBG2634951.1 hypothetical protein [Klebsiella michiganensis]MCW9474451.1 hypothetical protein [Klebsiella grimontii]MCW9644357.1 hypothetical protein [Klebsiella michiganensis]